MTSTTNIEVPPRSGDWGFSDFLCAIFAPLGLFVACAISAQAEELTLNQQLIVACYHVDVNSVIKHLRAGANTKSRFGSSQHEMDPFLDLWDGGTNVAAGKWTALMALSSAPEYPDPPKEFSRIWEDSDRVRAEQKRIGKEALGRRRAAEVTILCILLSHGAELNDDDGYGSTALHMAVDNTKPQLVRMLLHFGANPNTKQHIYIDGSDDITPLHSACTSKELLQLLLDYGANASAKDSQGRTPADWVALDDQRDFDLVATPAGPRIRPRNKPQ